MKVPRYLPFVLALLLINLETLNAATILGRVAIYTSSSSVETYPLVSGNKMTYGHMALIKISGGTLIADKGTVFEALDEGEQIAFRVEKGSIYLRILPDKGRVSFKTLQGEVFSPKVAPASSSTITGRIIVTDKDTIVEVREGTLGALNSKGLTRRVNAGQKINLAQAEIEGGAMPGVMPKVGDPGTNLNECIPNCKVQVEAQAFDAIVVDDELKPRVDLKGNPLPEGTVLIVKGFEGSTLLVQQQEEDEDAVYVAFLAALLEIFGALCATTLCDDDDEASSVQ